MSSKQNDTNQIHLGNYEEFFILYMDNELTSEQMKMVDDFLASHPDLRGEFEILNSIKLPSEEFSINKEELYAPAMKSASFINEDLLLYIDNELSSDKTKVVELELNSNKEYHVQHQLLLKTKLDASETITYPNKEELYRRTEKVIAFKLWMRVAAAIILVAVLSFFYYKQKSVDSNIDLVNADNVKMDEKNKPDNNNSIIHTEENKEIKNLQVDEQQENYNLAVNSKSFVKKSSGTKIKKQGKAIENVKSQIQQLLDNKMPDDVVKTNPELDKFRSRPEIIESPEYKKPAGNDAVNIPFVTSNPPDRTTNGTTPQEETVAKKGSVKGFLRKATRLIEKRTGFDPTNDGELLLGVVAVKLK